MSGLATVSKALNAGDVAKAQIATLFLHFPQPLPLTKSAPTRDEQIELVRALDWASLLKINYNHYPAKSPGGKGGQFAPKSAETAQAADQDGIDPANMAGNFDAPRSEAPKSLASNAAEREAQSVTAEEAGRIAERRAAAAATREAVENIASQQVRRQLRLATRRAFRKAALEALKNAGEKLALSEIPLVGIIADISTVYDVYRFAKDMIELRQAIAAATKFTNEGAHTLAQLRMSPVSETFKDFAAFVKFSPLATLSAYIEKKYGPAGGGMEYHHLIERTSRAAGDIVEDSDDIVRIPTIFHEAINAIYQRKLPEYGGLSLRNWLKKQPTAVRREWGKKAS